MSTVAEVINWTRMLALDDNVAKGKIAEEQQRAQSKDSLLTKEYNYQFLKQLQDAANAEAGISTNTGGR